ncbi:poly(A)-specific ribonuclease PARN-like [Arctopsyche grandis]|uniref:poly(A)-specific ribonuclease PARN-like n=1 Tax=Arctopsyche grandis TaxID=121162 RepID=UPI00406D63DC
MDVTRHNFFELLPEIEAAIDASDFLSIDGEFTGLSSTNAINTFDTPAECYQHFKTSSKDFLLIQFGLSTFRWDAKSQSYKHSDFTFFLFPRPQLKSAPDKVFSCQSSSIDFLSKHKFDFNKLFYDGISYVDTIEEARLRDRIQDKQQVEKETKLTSNDSSILKNSISIPESFQLQVNEICERVKKFLEDDQMEDVVIERLNAFQRKIIYQELKANFDKSILVETKLVSNEKRNLVVTRRTSEEEIVKKLEESHAKEWEELEAAVGFSLLARKISSSGKLVVGHCMILDVLHTIHDFFHPLPDVYGDFKSLTSHIFSSLLDTMFMVKTNTFKELFLSVDLSSMFETTSQDPFKPPKIEIEQRGNLTGYPIEKKEFHMAGYDAFITGASLVSIFDYLKRKNPFDVTGIDNDKLCARSKLLKPFLNKLFLYKTSFQASPCIYIDGSDPKPSRDHVFHVKFPKSWVRSDVTDLFEPYGGVGFIAFIDDISAYVSLKQHSQAAFVTSSLCKPQIHYKVTPYWESKGIDVNKTSNDVSMNQATPKAEINPRNDTVQLHKSHDSSSERKGGVKRKLSERSDNDSSEPVKNKSDEDVQKDEPFKSEKRKKKKEKKLSQPSVDEIVITDIVKKSKKGKKSKGVFEVSENWE